MRTIPHVQEGSFIHRYMEMMSEQETPHVYDFICACWCLSTALGRDVVVDRPRAPVHLNMYVILVSESGVMRKSTSVHTAVGIVRSFLQAQKSPMLVIENKITMGALLNELSRATRETNASQAVLVASELAAVLGRGTQIAGIPALLTDLYDCPDVRSGGGSLSTGSFNLKNVFCSFLAGSTPSWLATAVRPEIIAGGFTSRCYFIQGRDRKKLVAWPSEEDDANVKQRLTEQLIALKNESANYARIGISDGAKATFSRWYERRSTHKDAFRESFESREDSHVLRISAILAANDRRWHISDDHIRRGISFVEEIKRYGTDLFTNEKPETRRNIAFLHRVRNLIIAAGADGIGRSELYRSCNLSGRRGDELRTLLSTMHELDLIKKYELVNLRGRPKLMYVATEYLQNEQFLQDVAQKLGME